MAFQWSADDDDMLTALCFLLVDRSVFVERVCERVCLLTLTHTRVCVLSDLAIFRIARGTGLSDF